MDGVTQGFVIDTFLWGFKVETSPNSIVSIGPLAFGPPTASYLSMLNSNYSGMPPVPPTSGGTSTKFKFQAGCDNCFVAKTVPEPSSSMLLATGLLAIIGFAKSSKDSGSDKVLCSNRRWKLTGEG